MAREAGLSLRIPFPTRRSEGGEGQDLERILDQEGEDRTPQRATIYWVLALVLLLGTLFLRDSPWRTGPGFHTVTEVAATILSMVVGALALVRYYSRRSGTYLFIGTGFLSAAFLEGYHAVVTSPLFLPRWSSLELADLSVWTWMSARVFLSLFLFVSWLAWRRESWNEESAEDETSVYLTALGLTGLVFLFFIWVPVTQGYFPELPVHRPAELVPAVFFGLALGGYLWKGDWRTDPFEHWLVVALILSVASHAFYMPFSQGLYDAAYDAAHQLKVVSYVAVLIGLMVSVFVTFQREEEALAQIQKANAALAREIGVRREAERVLQEGEERLQDFLDNANDLILTTDPEGRLLYVNRAWTRVLGYSEEASVGRNLFDFVHPSSLPKFEDGFHRVLEGESLTRIEVGLLAKDGSTVLCSGGSNCRFENGRPVATRSILRDVTDQREAERELATYQANVAALVENTGDAIWSVGRDQRLITFNSAFSLAIEARIGSEPVKGAPPEETFRPANVDWYRECYQRALSGERFSRVREEEVMGQRRHYEFFFNPIQEHQGITGAVVFGRDVTRRVQAEEALRLAKEEAESANRAKSHFLASMSHELRTPLNSIIGFTNILLKNQDDRLSKKELGFLERVLANGRHLLSLINEVLDLAKIEAGRMELEIEPIDLHDLVRETVAQLEGQVKEKESVVLRSEVPEGMRPLETDSGKLKQVIINLVGNALKFTEEGEVVVKVEADPDSRRPRSLAVSDTGIGIPEDRLEAIFEAFQQAEAGTSRKYGGTGLGLAITRSICQMLDYQVMVESEVGVGSTFILNLGTGPRRAEEKVAGESAPDEEREEVRVGPEEEPEEGEEIEGEAEPRAPSSVRDFSVLVIDDEDDSRILMSHYLEDFGCQVFTAESAREGMALAREHRPDLITLDLMMPEVDGWDALEEMKADPDLRHIPVVVVSIVAGEGRGRLLGAVDLLTKPVDREDLLRVLWRNLVRKRGARVLVVEDDPDTRNLLRRYLEDAGLEAVTAADGEEGLQAVSREAPDAVLLDLMMPVMDGKTFLERLRETPEHVGLPVIVVTAKELTGPEQEMLDRKASAVVPKGEDLEERLREYLGALFPLEQS